MLEQFECNCFGTKRLPCQSAENSITLQHFWRWFVKFRRFTNRWSFLHLWVTGNHACFRLLNRCQHEGASASGTYPNILHSAVNLHDPDWSVRRGKEGQPFFHSARAGVVRRILADWPQPGALAISNCRAADSTRCAGCKVGKPDSARSLPLAPTATRERSCCPKSRRCATSA